MNVIIEFTPSKNIRLTYRDTNPPEFFVVPTGFPVRTRRDSVTLRLMTPEDARLYTIAVVVGEIALRKGGTVNVIFKSNSAFAPGPSIVIDGTDLLAAYDHHAQTVGDEQAENDIAADLASTAFLNILPTLPTVLRDVPVTLIERNDCNADD